MNRSIIRSAFALALLAAGAAWIHLGRRQQAATSVSARPRIEFPLQVEIPYVVECRGEATEICLPFDGDSEYLLVIGSLGDPHRTHTVQLESNPADRGRAFLRGHPLTPLNERPPGTCRPASPVGNPNSEVLRRESRDDLPQRALPPSEFFLHVTDGRLNDPRQYVRIRSRRIAVGPHVRVNRNQPTDARTRRTAEEIVRLFETRIRPRMRQLLGAHRDVDGDGRLTVLLTPWLGRLQGGKTSLGGLVRPADFRRSLAPPLSNRCDVLFLNSAVSPGPHLAALLAHEYAHVVTFSRRADGEAVDEHDWIAEGVAHVCEQILRTGWSNLGHRIDAFFKSPQSYPLVVSDYYGSGLWRNDGCRGATFLFLRWCVDQFGEGFLRRLITAPQAGVQNVEQASGCSFPALFRYWSLSLQGRFGEHDVHGPRPHIWNVESPRCRIKLRGTAVAFIRLRCPGDDVRRQICVRSEPAAHLQLTLLRLDGTARPSQIQRGRKPKSASSRQRNR